MWYINLIVVITFSQRLFQNLPFFPTNIKTVFLSVFHSWLEIEWYRRNGFHRNPMTSMTQFPFSLCVIISFRSECNSWIRSRRHSKFVTGLRQDSVFCLSLLQCFSLLSRSDFERYMVTFLVTIRLFLYRRYSLIL